MSRMGGACSMQQRQQRGGNSDPRDRHRLGMRRNGVDRESARSPHLHRSLRHSVVAAVPDISIASLYPLEDNYLLDDDQHRRSPKSLVELCIDTVCRTLPNLNGELPPGLPQDVVDDIVRSLMRHSALNATTLRALRNCELGMLSLASCRGVTDEWLEPLSCSYQTPASFDSADSTPPLSPNPFLSASSPFFKSEDGISNCMDEDHVAHINHDSPRSTYGNTETMVPFQLDDDIDHQNHDHKVTESVNHMEDSSSSCSTSSFLSATSSPAITQLTPMVHSYELSSPTPMDEHDDSSALLTLAERETVTTSEDPATTLDTAGCHQYDVPMDSLLAPVPIFLSSSTSNLTLLDLRGSQRLTDRGLLQLVDLSHLRVAKLDNCHSLVGRGLLALSNSHSLHTLSLANCRRLTDEGIINLAHLVSLESLSLDGCRCLTDRTLAALGGLYELRRLDLSQCDLISDDGLEHLANLEDLEELSLGWCRSITDRGIDTLTAQSGRNPRLRVLRLARCAITDKGVEYLGRLSALEELDLNGCAGIGGAVLGNALARLSRLETLDVSYCPGILRTSWQGSINNLKSLVLAYSGVRDSHVSKWMNLPRIQELSFDSCPVGDSAIAHLADNNVVPNLVTLDLADTDLTDIGMVSLPKFKNLVRLSLFYCNISNNGLRHISEMTDLEVLNLDSREIGDEGLWHLRNLTNLKSLDIFSGRITDSGCAHIAKITSLESLELCGGGVGDLGCNLLAGLENLTSLNLSQNDRITNRGAAALATLTKLKALNLSNTRVNAAALRFFSGLTNLQSLALYGCRGIDDEVGLDKLQSSLPSLKCLRLNGASEEDGIVVADSDESDDDNDEVEHSNVMRFAAQSSASSPNAGADEDSEDRSMYSDHD